MSHISRPRRRPHTAELVLSEPRRPKPTPSQTADTVAAIGGRLGQYAVFDAMSDVICTTTLDGTLLFLNRAGRDLLGHVDQEDSLIGCLFPMHTVAARALILDEVLPTVIRDGHATHDTALQTVDGRVFPASQTVVVTPGAPTTLTIVVRNVSIEEQATARLGESQRLFEMVARRSPDLLYLYDPEQERVVWTNRCPHAFLGGDERDARTLNRREIHRLLHPDDRALLRATATRMASAYSDHDVLLMEARVRTRGGAWRWIKTRTTPFSRRETGAPLLLLGVATDITTRKVAERRLVDARDAAEHANQAKTDFLAGVSREFRDSLHEMLDTITDVRDSQTSPIAAAARDALGDTIARGTKLLATVTDLRDFSRIEAADFPIDLALADLIDVVRSTVDSFERTSDGARDPITLRLPQRCAPVLTDAVRLKQVLSQLIGNALAVTHEGHVSVTLITDDELHTPIAIDIEDSGVGIAGERQARLFSPFDPVVQTGAGGHERRIGIGLALARALCELLGCTLNLTRSEAGAGSTFRIGLPLRSKAARLAAAHPGLEETRDAPISSIAPSSVALG